MEREKKQRVNAPLEPKYTRTRLIGPFSLKERLLQKCFSIRMSVQIKKTRSIPRMDARADDGDNEMMGVMMTKMMTMNGR